MTAPGGRRLDELTVQKGSLVRRLLERLNIRVGVSTRDFSLRTDVLPVVLLGDVSSEEALELGSIAIGSFLSAAIGGRVSQVQLFNPASSNKLIVAQQLLELGGEPLSPGPSGFYHITTQTAAQAFATNSAEVGWRDSRISGGPAGQVRGDNSGGAVIGTTVGRILGNGSTTAPRAFSWVLGPGSGVAISHNTAQANTALTACFLWAELEIAT